MINNIKAEIFKNTLNKSIFKQITFVIIIIVFSLNYFTQKHEKQILFEKDLVYKEHRFIGNEYEILYNKFVSNELTQNEIDRMEFLKEQMQTLYRLIAYTNDNKEKDEQYIILETNYLKLLNQGISKGYSTKDENIVKEEIALNDFLIENNIIKFSSQYEIKLFNFFIRLWDSSITVLFVIVLIKELHKWFSQEYEFNSYIQYYSSPLSRTQIFYSKIISALLRSMIIWFIIAFIPLIFFLFFGNNLTQEYGFVLHNKTVINHSYLFILILLYSLITFLACSVIVVSISQITRNSTLSFLFSFLIMIILYYLETFNFVDLIYNEIMVQRTFILSFLSLITMFISYNNFNKREFSS